MSLELDAELNKSAMQTKSMPFEVYVHVPFCLRRCGYCDFNTYTARDLGEGASREGYADVAIREMQLVKNGRNITGFSSLKRNLFSSAAALQQFLKRAT